MSATMENVAPSGSTRAALAAPLACGACLVAGAAYLTAVDPSDGGVFVPCPFRSLTGWWCPGCGLTRATHHLLRGDVVLALRFNALVLVVLAVIALSWARWTWAAAGRRTVRSLTAPGWLTATLIVVAVGFAVVRNLPAVDFLRG